MWSIKTKFDLVPSTIKVIVNLKFNSLPSWHITNAPQAQRLAPHIFHVSFKEGDLYNDMHLIYFTWCEIFTKIQCPRSKGYIHRRLLCLMRFVVCKPHLGGFARSTGQQALTPLWVLGSWRSLLPLFQSMRHISHWFRPWCTKDLALA